MTSLLYLILTAPRISLRKYQRLCMLLLQLRGLWVQILARVWGLGLIQAVLRIKQLLFLWDQEVATG